MTMTTMMKAARFHEYGGTSVIRYEAVARPQPASGEVLLRVAATSFNPTEAALRAGLLHAFLPVDLPYTPGWDVAGTKAVRRQGADRVIDYTAGPVGGALDAPVDTLLNLVPLSPPDAAALAPLVRPGGRIVSIATPIEPAADAGVSAMHMVARNDVAQLAALVGLVDTAALGIDISASRPLADLADVHRLSEAGRTRGKVIIIP